MPNIPPEIFSVNMFDYLRHLDFLGGLSIGINLLFVIGIPLAFLMVVKKCLDRLFR